MFDPVSSDKAIESIRLALGGLARRQEINSNNIVNADTPGFQAQQVTFEDTLKSYLAGDTSSNAHLFQTNERHIDVGGQSDMISVTEKKDGTPRADGNNVNIDSELLQMNETGVRYTALAELASRKLKLLQAIALSR